MWDHYSIYLFSYFLLNSHYNSSIVSWLKRKNGQPWTMVVLQTFRFLDYTFTQHHLCTVRLFVSYCTYTKYQVMSLRQGTELQRSGISALLYCIYPACMYIILYVYTGLFHSLNKRPLRMKTIGSFHPTWQDLPGQDQLF